MGEKGNPPAGTIHTDEASHQIGKRIFGVSRSTVGTTKGVFEHPSFEWVVTAASGRPQWEQHGSIEINSRYFRFGKIARRAQGHASCGYCDRSQEGDVSSQDDSIRMPPDSEWSLTRRFVGRTTSLRYEDRVVLSSREIKLISC
jgi:hypothetical protein